MKLFVVANINHSGKIKPCQEVIDALRVYHDLSLCQSEAQAMDRPDLVRFPVEEADLIVSIGGDGTMLKASRLAYPANKEILGINAGHLGALCAFRRDEFDPKDLLKGCERQKRHGLLFKSSQYEGFAFNDIVVTSPTRARSIYLGLRLGEKAMMLRGDGILIATPTGSTAYNHSLGGPVLRYDEPKNIVLPLASLDTSLNKAILADKSLPIRIEPSDNRFLIPTFVYDGLEMGPLDSPLEIRGSDRPVTIYKKACHEGK